MGILDRILNRKQYDGDEASMTITTQGTGFAELPDVNYSNYAKEGYEKNELVFACIREIATSASEAPAMATIKKTDPVEYVETGQLADLLENPNNYQTRYELIESIITFLQITGNAYLYKERSTGGLSSIYCLRPDRIKIVPNKYYEYEIDGKVYNIPIEDVGHIKFPNPTDDHYGLSPLQPMARIVNLDLDATDFTRTFFRNAGVPSGLLKLKRKIANRDEADRIRTAWRSQFQGIRNWHRIAVLDDDASYEAMGSNIADMEIDAIRDLSESRICAALGVPPILVGAKVGLKTATYSNYAQAKESFWEETLLPLYRRIEDSLNRIILPELPGVQNTEKITFNFSDVRALQDDETDMWNRNLIKARIVKELVTAGYDPAQSLNAAGLDEIDHLGIPPTSLQSEQSVILEGPRVQDKISIENITEGKQKVPSADKVRLNALARRIMAAQEKLGKKFIKEIEPEMKAYFRRSLNKADAIIGRTLSDSDTEQKSNPKVPYNADDLIPIGADIELQAMFRPMHMRIIESTFNVLNKELPPASALAFEETLPTVQQFIVQGATRVKDINNATRKKITDVIAEGERRGYNYNQIARGVSGENYNGVKSVVRETYKNRARAIARSEVGFSQNSAAYARYHGAGIEKVFITDAQRGTEHDDVCLEVADTIQPLSWLSTNMLQHPNCSRVPAPVVE
jgi:HK97 family phage portal protein